MLDLREINDPFSFPEKSEEQMRRKTPRSQAYTTELLSLCSQTPHARGGPQRHPRQAGLPGLPGQHQSCQHHPAEHGESPNCPAEALECHSSLCDQTQGCFCRNAHPNEVLMSFQPREAARKRGDGSWRQEISLRQSQSHPRLTAEHVHVIISPL